MSRQKVENLFTYPEYPGCIDIRVLGRPLLLTENPRDFELAGKVLPDLPLKPFLKWPGGKRWLVQRAPAFFEQTYDRYVEPFLGGGAVYLYNRPRNALVGDVNPDVICVYNAMRSSWRGILSELRRHQIRHSEHHYYAVRDAEPHDAVEKAARILYLNRTCFNGIYRVNRNGKFNVPKGTKDSVVFPDDNFEAVSNLLQAAVILHCDFEEIVSRCGAGDFLFADPPYTVRHNNNGFIKYNEKLFSWSDQQRLAVALSAAHRRGANVLCTNADHESVRALYDPGLFEMSTVTRFSSISGAAASRRHFSELVIRSRGRHA
ncbi:DNA adenine methylase [Rhizobium anhuiense]